MMEKAREVINRCRMLEQGDGVLVCVSGGADSMALLHLLHALGGEYRLRLAVCHVNHGIRGGEALRDQRAVEEFCARLGVECLVHTFDVPSLARERRLSLEECGRGVRYETFSRIADERGLKIATAHTLSDSIETMLFHLARGTGLKGLCGIPPVRGRIIRPLIEATRGEVETYCAQNHIAYITDSTNLSAEYTRNRIRLEVVPALLRVHPGSEDALLRAQRSFREDEQYLCEQAAKALASSVRGKGWDAQALQAQAPAIKNRALRELLTQNGLEPDSERIVLIGKALASGEGAVTLSGVTRARVTGGILTIGEERPAATPDYAQSLRQGEFDLFEKKRVNVSFLNKEGVKSLKKVHPKLLKNALDYDTIIGTALFRPRKEGDSIRLSGRGCTKSLKKLMNEAGIQPEARARITVLADEAGTLWVEGFGCAERTQVTESTKRALLIQIQQE